MPTRARAKSPATEPTAMHYRIDIKDAELESALALSLTPRVASTGISIPVLFVDEAVVNARPNSYGKAVILVRSGSPTRAHMPLLWAGRVHAFADVSALNEDRLQSVCWLAEATAKWINDSVATRTLEREHFVGTPLPLIRTAIDGARFIAANPAMVDLLGYDSEQDLLAIDPRTGVYADPSDREIRFEEYRRTGRMSPMNFAVKRKDGSIIEVVHQAATVLDHLDEPRYIEGSFVDITELQAARRQVEALNRDLLAAHRKAGMAEIASGVLHNVGNALNSVKVSVALLEESAQARRVGDRMRQIGERLRSIKAIDQDQAVLTKLAAFVERLGQDMDQRHDTLATEFAAAQRGLDHISDVIGRQQRHARTGTTAEPLELDQLIRDAIAINQVDEHAELTTTLDSGDAVLLDRHLLLQVVGNLLQNAAHAVAENNDRKPAIDVELRQRTGHAVIRVCDNGSGISPENQKQLFNYGFTTKDTGHGFGLHSSALAIQEMGGELRFHSDGEGHGAEFSIVLPLTPAQENELAAG